MKIPGIFKKSLATNEDYRTVFDSPTGRKVLKHLLRTGYVSVPIWSGDLQETAKRAGMQHIVLSIVRAVYGKDPEEVIDNLVEETYEDAGR